MKMSRVLASLVVLILIFHFQTSEAGESGEKSHSTHQKMLKGYSSGWKVVKKKKNRFTEKEVKYSVPDVTLTDQDGKNVRLGDLLSLSEPYALNFIFVTCTTICPIMTVTFLSMQDDLGSEVDSLKLISITIDPEHDTPKVLKEYANKMGAVKNWTFLTGDYDTVISVEKAFDGYTADKMNHKPFTLFKLGDNTKWVRVDGLASGSDLADTYRRLINNNK